MVISFTRGEPCSPARMQSIRIARVACKLSIHRSNYIKSYVFNRKFRKAGEHGSPLQNNNSFATFIKLHSSLNGIFDKHSYCMLTAQ